MPNNIDCKIIHICSNPYSTVTNESIVWINDVFDQNELSDMLRGQTPAYIVNDHYNIVDTTDLPIYCAPLFLAANTASIVKNLPETQSYKTEHIFNFMINKKQVNRFLCIKLVELFELTNYDYTWSGVDSKFDMTDILEELEVLGTNSPINNKEKTVILSDIQIPTKFFDASPKINNSHINYNSNSWTWNRGLRNIFSNSAVSLITESLSFEKSTVFTEKTAYAILGKTFPIWIGGGVNQSQEFEAMGFDTFNDVIDHSYQHYDTLIERCYYAFERNLHILTDYKYASEIRNLMMDRLDHNQHLIKNKQVDIFCKQVIQQWPIKLQQAIDGELKKWI